MNVLKNFFRFKVVLSKQKLIIWYLFIRKTNKQRINIVIHFFFRVCLGMISILFSAGGRYKHWGNKKFTKDISVTLFPYIGIILSSIMDGKNQSVWQVVHASVCWREDLQCGDSSKQCVYRLILHIRTFHSISLTLEINFYLLWSNI